MNLLGLSNNFVKNVFIHVSWILKPQIAVELARKIASKIHNVEDKKSSIMAIGYLNEFFQNILNLQNKSKILSLNQDIDSNQKLETN
jgi:hypothetical protein